MHLLREVFLMKKRIIAALLCALVLSCTLLTSCGNLFGGETIEVAMITDGGDVGAGSMNQAVWDVVANFAIANGKSYDAYQPVSSSREDRVDIIMQAIVKGAMLVVCSGQALSEAVYEVQDLFPDVTFLLVDGIPTAPADTKKSAGGLLLNSINTTAVTSTAVAETTALSDTKISSNVYCLTFREEQAGYLAGYVVTRNGYTHLGFMSEKDSDSDMLYGYGFLQGVEDAARDMGITERINVIFRYSGNGTTDDEFYNTAKSWYLSGTEVIFASGNSYSSVIEAAEECNGRVICSDSDHSSDSNLVVTSAMKMLEKPLKEALQSLKANNYKWDKDHSARSVLLGLDDGAVGLATDSWRFGAFTVESYESVAAKIVAGEIKISNDKTSIPDLDIAVEFQS